MPRIITALISLLAALALGFFYTLPQWQRFQTLGSDVQALAEVSVEFDKLIASRDSLLERINSITKDNLDRLDSVFPQGPHTSDLLVSLEALTVENSVALGQVNLTSPDVSNQTPPIRPGGQPRPTGSGSVGATAGQASVSTAAQELSFSIQITGSYSNFKKFLASVEKNLRLIDVDSISFNAGGKADESLGISVKAKTYYQ